jgi:hypothetical protein
MALHARSQTGGEGVDVRAFKALEHMTGLLREDEAIWDDDREGVQLDLHRKLEVLDETRRIADTKASMLRAMYDDLCALAADLPVEQLAMPRHLLIDTVRRHLTPRPPSAPDSDQPTPRMPKGHLAIRATPAHARPVPPGTPAPIRSKLPSRAQRLHERRSEALARTRRLGSVAGSEQAAPADHGSGASAVPGSAASGDGASALPSAVQSLVLQLHEMDSALERLLTEQSTCRHMLARDAKATEELRRRDVAKRASHEAFLAKVRAAHVRAQEAVSAQRLARRALEEARTRYERTKRTHAARLGERSDRQQHASWFNTRRPEKRRARGAEETAVEVLSETSELSQLSLASEDGHDDPALATSEGYRVLFGVSRRLGVEVDEVAELMEERVEQMRVRTEAELRLREMRVTRDLWGAKLAKVQRARDEEERRAAAADGAAGGAADWAAGGDGRPALDGLVGPGDEVHRAEEYFRAKGRQAEARLARARARLEALCGRAHETLAGLRHLEGTALAGLPSDVHERLRGTAVDAPDGTARGVGRLQEVWLARGSSCAGCAGCAASAPPSAEAAKESIVPVEEATMSLEDEAQLERQRGMDAIEVDVELVRSVLARATRAIEAVAAHHARAGRANRTSGATPAPPQSAPSDTASARPRPPVLSVGARPERPESPRGLIAAALSPRGLVAAVKGSTTHQSFPRPSNMALVSTSSGRRAPPGREEEVWSLRADFKANEVKLMERAQRQAAIGLLEPPPPGQAIAASNVATPVRSAAEPRAGPSHAPPRTARAPTSSPRHRKAPTRPASARR